jgi:hypothetical protein
MVCAKDPAVAFAGATSNRIAGLPTAIPAQRVIEVTKNAVESAAGRRIPFVRLPASEPGGQNQYRFSFAFPGSYPSGKIDPDDCESTFTADMKEHRGIVGLSDGRRAVFSFDRAGKLRNVSIQVNNEGEWQDTGDPITEECHSKLIRAQIALIYALNDIRNPLAARKAKLSPSFSEQIPCFRPRRLDDRYRQ